MTLIVLSVLIISLYVGIQLYFLRVWYRIPNTISCSNDLTAFSVIIPARNESEHIISCLKSWEAQEYPKSAFEIIIINDHSDDGTTQLIKNYQSDLDIHVIELAEGKEGKKTALWAGFNKARFPICITSDADCEAPSNFLNAQHKKWQTNPDLIVGPIRIKYTSKWIQKLQALDINAMMLVTAAGIHTQKLYSANGANLSVRKNCILVDNPYSDNALIPSGDDVFLIQKMALLQPNKIAFIKDKQAIIETSAIHSLKGFIQQRLRWGGKAKAYKHLPTQLYLFLIFAAHVIVALLFVMAFWNIKFLITFSIVYIIKLVVDYILLTHATRFFNQQILMKDFIWIQGLHHLYLIVVGVLSVLPHSYSWKDRKY